MLLVRKHALLYWPVSRRGRRELCYSGKTESLVQRKSARGKNGSCLFSAGDLRIKRREGDTDGEVIKTITSGDNKSVGKMCETENSVSQRTEPSRAHAQAPTKGFSSLKVRGYRQN